MKSQFSVYSDIGKLRKVLLHRPARELENLCPENMKRLLFDDIPYLEAAAKEHDEFALVLRNQGAEVIYLEDLVSEVFEDQQILDKFLDQYLEEAHIIGDRRKPLKEFFLSRENSVEMINYLMGGLRKDQFLEKLSFDLHDYVHYQDPFLIEPMPNLYFSRDYFSVVGRGATVNSMTFETRRRETIFMDYVFQYHPQYQDIPMYYHRDEVDNLEGGDILVLSHEIVAVGISERTKARAVEKFARNLLFQQNEFKTVLAFQIPNRRAFMHLDTVFTMVDTDAFTVHPEIEGPLEVYALQAEGEKLKIQKEERPLDEILEKYLHLEKVRLIRCGGGEGIDASREQWNDGSNTLAIAPGEVIVYDRNTVTNRHLEEAGIKLYPITSSELSRGRGGPRCMSMPLVRDKL